jgi:hypothetical protein
MWAVARDEIADVDDACLVRCDREGFLSYPGVTDHNILLVETLDDGLAQRKLPTEAGQLQTDRR